MPKLPDKRHEAYAQALAINCSQQTAAKRAGFTAGATNKAFLSRLANRKDVKERVEALKKETSQKIQAVMTVSPAQETGSLAEMGLTMDWVTEQFQNVYDKALKAGNFSAANASVQHLQKILETEQAEQGDAAVEAGADKISVKDTLALLSDLREIITPPEDAAETGGVPATKVRLLRHRHDK